MELLGIPSEKFRFVLLTWRKWSIFFPFHLHCEMPLESSVAQCCGNELCHWTPWFESSCCCLPRMVAILSSWDCAGCSATMSDPFPPLSAVTSAQGVEIYGLHHLAPRPSNSIRFRPTEGGKRRVRVLITFQSLHTAFAHWGLNLGSGCSPLWPQLSGPDSKGSVTSPGLFSLLCWAIMTPIAGSLWVRHHS